VPEIYGEGNGGRRFSGRFEFRRGKEGGIVEVKKKPTGAHPEKRFSATAVRNLPPGRHADGNGLYLEVDESGARRWMLRTVVHGRRRCIGLGGASLVTLAEAREKARELRKVAREGGDPIAARDKGKRRSVTFAEAARQVHAEQIVGVGKNGKHVDQWISTLEAYAFPVVGTKAVHTIDQADVLRILAPIWTEKPETARRVRQRIRTVLDWARTAGHRDGVNPVDGVESGLARQRRRVQHHEALPWAELPVLMPRIAAAGGMGALALRFAILTAARSGEVRGAGQTEFDIEARTWTIPAGRMKMEREHRVPLSAAAVAVLKEALALGAANDEELVFPSARRGKPLSDMTLAAVLKRLDVPVTVHGFRSTFRDWAEERTGFTREVKEAALAHVVGDKAEAAYRRTDLFDKRRKLMDAWATFATAELGKIVELGARR
jgi:integrase